MADIAAANVTYALVEGSQQTNHNSRYEANFDIGFGNSTLTYPANGIPLTKASLGCPASLEKVDLFSPSAGDGFLYKYDKTNVSIRIYRSAVIGTPTGAAALIELVSGSTAPAATSIRANVSGW